MASRVEKTIWSFALERSGHNAVLGWIMKHAPLPTLMHWHINRRDSKSLHAHRVYMPPKSFYVPTRWVIVDHADPLLPHDYKFMRGESYKIRPEGIEQAIIILRDPFNMMASRLQVRWTQIVHPREITDCWKKLAREALRIENELEVPVVISFNDWFSKQKTREEVGEALGLVGGYANEYQAVKQTGGGSSFDGRQFDGNASEMQVLDRWKIERNNFSLKYMADDDELVSLSEELFGNSFIQEIMDGINNG